MKKFLIFLMTVFFVLGPISSFEKTFASEKIPTPIEILNIFVERVVPETKKFSQEIFDPSQYNAEFLANNIQKKIMILSQQYEIPIMKPPIIQIFTLDDGINNIKRVRIIAIFYNTEASVLEVGPAGISTFGISIDFNAYIKLGGNTSTQPKSDS